jgi:hypothetical protein
LAQIEDCEISSLPSSMYAQGMPFQFGFPDLAFLAIFVGVIWLIGWSLYRLIRMAVAAGVRDGQR